MAVTVLWYSRHNPLPKQVEHLKKLYRENVNIVVTNRRFETGKQFLNYINSINANAVYAVLPLSKIDELMNTETGKKVDWLWAEYVELNDGVRTEKDKGFDPTQDEIGYFFGMGQHRRFLGFSKITKYELAREPLEDIPEIENKGRKYMPKAEWKRAWAKSFEDMKNLLEKNKVSVKIVKSKKYPNSYFVSVSFGKDTDMFEQLRPALKNMGFAFNDKHKDWNRVVSAEEKDTILNKIVTSANTVLENIAVRILLKNGLAEKNAGYLLNKSMEKTGEVISVEHVGIEPAHAEEEIEIDEDFPEFDQEIEM